MIWMYLDEKYLIKLKRLKRKLIYFTVFTKRYFLNNIECDKNQTRIQNHYVASWMTSWFILQMTARN